MTEVVVTEDVAGAALRWFQASAPRVISLAGGSTPRAFYERLAVVPYPWEEVTLVPGDERCVPPDDPDSNRLMIESSLLAPLEPRPRAVWLPGDTCDPDEAERRVRAAIGSPPKLDLAILGLGEDGHTASLFPGDPALEETERWVVRVERPDHPRLTLTPPVLSAARTAMFVVTGREKREALRRFLAGDDIPAARIRSREVLVIADPAAGSPVS